MKDKTMKLADKKRVRLTNFCCLHGSYEGEKCLRCWKSSFERAVKVIKEFKWPMNDDIADWRDHLIRHLEGKDYDTR